MTPDQAIALLRGDWPPKTEHWPPRDKSTWKPGMTLAGRIEAVLTLPRPDGSKHRGEPYTALYVRRESDRRLVTFHGWHKAALEDLPAMHPAQGLLFVAVYRGRGPNDFEDFKFLVTPYDLPARPAAGDHETRQDTGQAERRRSTQAPEGKEGEGSSPSGSNGQIDLRRITTVAKAEAYVRDQSAAWQATFRRLAAEARDTGETNGWSKLGGYHQLISRTHALRARGGEAA